VKKKAIEGGIDVQCVYDKKHKKTITYAEANRGMPFCDIDGGPMIAVRAKVKR
jgi:hypothetical protein